MTSNEFVQKFASQFDETDASLFEPGTVYKDLGEWSSLLALSVIAMVDDEFGLTITGKEIAASVTIADLYALIESKKANV